MALLSGVPTVAADDGDVHVGSMKEGTGRARPGKPGIIGETGRIALAGWPGA
jgi:hypothetical protein